MKANRWIASGHGYRVKSPTDLMTAIGRIGTLQVGHRYVWRGAADAQWSIQSSLQRYIQQHPGGLDPQAPETLKHFERLLVQKYRGWGLDPEGRELVQASLALMQHHSIPTRLLDVTCNPMTALWFATQPLKETVDGGTKRSAEYSGVLFGFDVTGFPELPTHGRLPLTYGSFHDPDWHYEHRLAESAEEGRPFLIDPRVRDPRMLNQEGLFLCGVPDSTRSIPGVEAFALRVPTPAAPLEDFFAAVPGRGRPRTLPFLALVIPPGLKAKLRHHLESTFNKRPHVLFPDIAGLRAHLPDVLDLPGELPTTFEDSTATDK